MFISYPHNYHFYLLSNYKEILTINSKNINIINNILHLEEKMLVMFYNFGTLNLGSNKTETIRIENNKIINNYYNSYLFYNETERDTNRTKTISKIDAENIYISNNILISAIEEAILFTTNLVNFNYELLNLDYELLNLGSNKTKTITIKDNKIKACLDSFLFNKISSITLISEEINFTNNNL